MKANELERLLRVVFAPREGERAAVIVDMPPGPEHDHAEWRDRRRMAAEWRQALRAMGVDAATLRITAPETHNADFPPDGMLEGRPAAVKDVLGDCSLALAFTEYSVSAPLFAAVRAAGGRLRAASMPGILRRMEETALAADYEQVARRAEILASLLDRSVTAEVLFAGGERMFFDLRHRRAHADRGLCRPGKTETLVNLPGGEAWVVPYEGELAGDPSRTSGRLPVGDGRDRACFAVTENRIRAVTGNGELAGYYRDLFAREAACCNVAEFGLGCNDRAVVGGNVLEDEKAGFHWAYGRSDHLGGTVGADDFSDRRRVVHQDLVYARGCAVEAKEIVLYPLNGAGKTVQRDGEYVPGLFE